MQAQAPKDYQAIIYWHSPIQLNKQYVLLMVLAQLVD
jgi:hypothetical protein